MLVIGLDAASDPSKFGYALGDVEQDCVSIRRAGLVKTKGDPNALTSVIAPELQSATRALVAIDAPLGWPAGMANELKSHRAGMPFSVGKDEMFQRETDRLVHGRIKKKPLEVGADKIARAAYTALWALSYLREATGKTLPLAWSPDFAGAAVVEVYPGATLKARGLAHSGYKEAAQRHVRSQIAAALVGEVNEVERYIDGSADVFDACLCLAAAKDFLDGLAEPPTDIDLAKREGWIWLRARSH